MDLNSIDPRDKQALADFARQMRPKIEATEEKARKERCTELAAELKAAEKRFVTERDIQHAERDKVEDAMKKLEAELKVAKERWSAVSNQFSTLHDTFTRLRDDLWLELTTVADPAIAVYRREIQTMLDETVQLHRTWPGPFNDGIGRNVYVDNNADVERLQRALLAAIDAPVRWAREGLQGTELTAAFDQLLLKLPMVSMGPSAPAQGPS